MRRLLIAALVSVLAMIGFAGTAAAQDEGYPPPPPATGGEVSATGALLPGATVDLTVTCAALVPGVQYTGTLDGAPIGTAVGEAGSVTFDAVTIPGDFELDEFHSIQVSDGAGVVVCDVQFFVDAQGNITDGPVTVTTAPPAAGGAGLPRTGSDFTETGLRVGGAAVALGAVAVALAASRRRKAIRASA